MGTQFKDVADMFKRLPKVAERARAFVGKATRVPAKFSKNRLPEYIGRMFVAPAANAGVWDHRLADVPCSYLMATDGDRLHVALVATKDVPADAVPYEPRLLFIEVAEGAAAATSPGRGGRTVVLNARYLREAISTGAQLVAITLPAKEGEAVTVTGLAQGYGGYGQMSWASVMPVVRVLAGGAPPKLALPEDEATTQAGEEPEQD